jgi:hypothetical protein
MRQSFKGCIEVLYSKAGDDSEEEQRLEMKELPVKTAQPLAIGWGSSAPAFHS